MIGVNVVFDYAGTSDFDRDRITKVAADYTGMFEGMPGLRLKVFTLDQERQRAVNLYVWDSEEAARSFFSEELREMVVKLYGVPPAIEFVEVAALVDNGRD
jgi:heme-degrading monooxygenase HmoA